MSLKSAAQKVRKLAAELEEKPGARAARLLTTKEGKRFEAELLYGRRDFRFRWGDILEDDEAWAVLEVDFSNREALLWLYLWEEEVGELVLGGNLKPEDSTAVFTGDSRVLLKPVRRLLKEAREAASIWKAKRKRALWEEAVKGLEELSALLQRARGCRRKPYAEGPFRLLQGEGTFALWNRAAHPFPELLDFLPGGGRYRGPLPGYPGTEVEVEVPPGRHPAEARAVFLSLRVGGLPLKPRKGSQKEVELFRNRPSNVAPKRVLEKLFGLEEPELSLLAQGKTKEAEKLVALKRIEAS